MKSLAARPVAAFVVPLGALLLLSLAHCGDGSEETRDPAAPDASSDVTTDTKKPARDASPAAALPDSLTERAGTRFQPLYSLETYDDGARRKVFEGVWYDAQERRRCTLSSLGDGRWGCVPIDRMYLQKGFRDAACTVPVLFATGTPKSTTYASWGEACTTKVGIVTTQPTVGSAYTNEDGRCYQRSTTARLYAEPTALDDAALGEFKRTSATSELPTERSGTRLTVVTDTFTGPDGSFASMNPVVVDHARDVEGRFYPGEDGNYHFLPAERWASESLGFVDDACTESLVNLGSVPGQRCEASRPVSTNALQHVGTDPRSDCRPVRAVAAPTKPVVPTVYLVSSNSCSLMSYPGTDTYTKDSFVELPRSETPEVTNEIVASDARAVHGEKIEFRAPRATSLDGLDQTSRASVPYLRQYGLPCDIQLASGQDGVEFRCLPRVATIFSYGTNVYADAACKQRVLRFETWTMTCGADPTLYKVVTDHDLYAYTVFRRPAAPPLGQPYYYWLGDDGSCNPSDADKYSLYYAVTATESVVPATDFPLVTVGDLAP
ncbi:Type I restriction-modification system, restriction subunit R [Labilithrix luteola]|uniref:Type I restriction-modification system, restriction subunit R n=1 Tax=Labilithrix luteola TaxID=1391654 RepID=A0A0K1Q1S1_9BACT|nr:hypothetical protein [Labilithrix luteola]AKU99596.1 Type I restriction-modification system, restriction subunit R [Labilithrix luteola]